ncbi:MAG: tetratricopeptide repeat protein [Bacteroidales bacterium]|nr:tetratricopeptide repeat protein [Muribaculaceae bacterium]MCI6856499.1 tetratricopeptide repeat protein [Bacteroidales bacterium]MDY4942917.1 tetratricopeptide repeat protein [Candidatus Limisoma sp.]MDD7603496.1 tetratricopeptide repeat protein [Bacteroidales bacterium]MDY5893473.1 tetratricopeptide repeat protein [Candidatus Limisoma sp.]
MKRKSILTLCAIVSLGAFAQQATVKDVEKAIGGLNPDVNTLVDAANKIKSALTNAETKDDAKTWYVAGKANFAIYDKQQTAMMMKQPIDTALMGGSVVEGYKYFMAALPLDSVKQLEKDGSYKLEKDGSIKVKTKYSKEIVNTLVTRHEDFNRAGGLLYDSKRYKEAAEAWGIYSSLPYSGLAERSKFVVADTILGMTAYYQGIALWQAGNVNDAVGAFANARKLGYKHKEAYDYALSCAAQAKDNVAIVAIAEEAYKEFGGKDIQYLNVLINDKLSKEEFDDAETLINDALKVDANNAELLNLKGLIVENKGNEDAALDEFKKAIEIDNTLAQGYFNAGRIVMKKVVAQQKAMETMNRSDYAKAKEEVLIPLLKEALPYMERAYQLDDTNANAKRILSNIYYQLGDEEALQALDK